MGKHYVPQKYLRGFEDPSQPSWIWMYDKQFGTCKLLPIKQVAQEPDFYTPDIEEVLNEQVEKPANAVIDKLRQGGAIDDEDRVRLAYYVASMLHRVPHFRNNAYDMAPAVLADTARKLREHIEALGRQGLLAPEMVARRLAETDAAERKFEQDLPAETIEMIETPWPTQQDFAAVFMMTWRFCSTDGPSFFLTSDNPAFFFECFGLGTHNAELIFPLGSTLLMHCSWQKTSVRRIIHVRQFFVREFNRRIAIGATRFIFYQAERDWVHKIARSTVQQCNRIDWEGGLVP